jgi:predicted nuclease of predicted toxin-antitoxin system
MSHFLIDASLPRSSGNTIRAHGHQATDVRDIGMGAASDQEIADHARLNQLALVSADLDFANVVVYPPADYHGLIVIRAPDGATVAMTLYLVEQLLNNSHVMSNLVGRLAIVEPARIRLRPPV